MYQHKALTGIFLRINRIQAGNKFALVLYFDS